VGKNLSFRGVAFYSFWTSKHGGLTEMDLTKAELVRRIDRLKFENKNLKLENRLLSDKFVIRSFISEVFKRLFMR
jgi:hypothetical protein